jgi:hypothetical protein
MNQKRVFLVPMFQMAAGLGWIGGTYAEPAQSLWLQIGLQAVHYIPVLFLFLFGVRFLTNQDVYKDWGRSGLILLSIFVKVATIAWIIVSFTHILGLAGPHSFDDWFPIGVTNAGSGLLLGLLLTRQDQRPKQPFIQSVMR